MVRDEQAHTNCIGLLLSLLNPPVAKTDGIQHEMALDTDQFCYHI